MCSACSSWLGMGPMKPWRRPRHTQAYSVSKDEVLWNTMALKGLKIILFRPTTRVGGSMHWPRTMSSGMFWYYQCLTSKSHNHKKGSMCLPGHVSCRSELGNSSVRRVLRPTEAVRVVIRCPLLVVGEGLRSVTLVVGYTCPIGTVYWYLQVVGSQPVAVCVWVAEKSTLPNVYQMISWVVLTLRGCRVDFNKRQVKQQLHALHPFRLHYQQL
jgi:hypothetical protein